MQTEIGYQFADLINNAAVYASSLNLSDNDPGSVPYIDSNQTLQDYVLTNGHNRK